MRAACVALFAALVLVASGCGSDGVSAGEAGAAELLRAGAIVYWETDSDPDSDQWQQVEELLKRFPDGEKWIAELRRSFEEDTKVTWEELEAALGDQVAVAAYGSSAQNLGFVGLTKPADMDKALEVVRKLNESDDAEDAVTRQVDGWLVLSDKESSIDAALKGEDGQPLSDADGFEEGMEELPEDSLSRVYVNVAAAVDAFADADPNSAQALRMLGLHQVEFAGGWATAKDDGAEIAGVASGEGADKLFGAGEEYTSKFLDLVPDDAFAFYSFQGAAYTEQLEGLRSNPLYGMGFQEVETMLGVKVAEILELFEGEVAFYAAPGTPIPELTLLLESKDLAKSRATAERILRSLAQQMGGEVAQQGDVLVASLMGFTVNLGSVDGSLVLTTVPGALEELAADGDKLPDSEAFEAAMDVAETPDEYTGLVYADLSELVQIIRATAGVAREDLPAEVTRNLEPLRSLVVHGSKDGDLAKSLFFLEIGE